MKLGKIELTEEERIEVSIIFNETNRHSALLRLYTFGRFKDTEDYDITKILALKVIYEELLEKVVEKYRLKELEETF